MPEPQPNDLSAALFNDPEFLDIVAHTYFPGQGAAPRDYLVAGQVFRLLTVPGQGPVVKQTFIDMHEPLRPAPPGSKLPALRRLDWVAGAPRPLADVIAAAGALPSLGAPTLLWSAYGSWDDFAATLKTRHFFVEDRRHSRQLKALLGDIEYRDDDSAADVLPTCMGWKSARDREARRPEVFAVPANRQFFAALRSRGLLRASTLRAGGALLAISLGTVHRQRCSGWIVTFNPDRALRKYSLGRRLLVEMLESSCRAGHREFDFSIGMEPYKLDFATHLRPIGALGVPPLRERLVIAGRSMLRRLPWFESPARAIKGWLHAPRA